MLNRFKNLKPYWILIFPIVGLIFGLLVALNPYQFVSPYVAQKLVPYGNPSLGPGLLWFTIKSDGVLTANYPIEVKVKNTVSNGVENLFAGASDITIYILDSYHYPENGSFTTGYIKISLKDNEGVGRIIFPYPGSFYDYHISTNVNPMVWSSDFYTDSSTHPIFVVEDYGARVQIENSNRSIGIAIASLSFTVIGLVGAVIKRAGHHQ
jgi:hypothetical protein